MKLSGCSYLLDYSMGTGADREVAILYTVYLNAGLHNILYKKICHMKIMVREVKGVRVRVLQ